MTGNNKHYALTEEVLIPNTDKTDAPRVNMVCSHFTQTLTINGSETPLVFSRFENQVGKYSSAYKKVNNVEVITKIKRNDNNISYIIKDKDKDHFDIINFKSSTCLTENYGYENTLVTDLEVGKVYDRDTVVYRNNMYDDDLNMKLGCNLKAVYVAHEGLTYEDAIVVSKSTAEKMAHTEVNEIIVTLNENDILINTYGTIRNFKCFPNIGESTKNGILCSRRRIDYNSVLEDFKNNKLDSIIDTDTKFYVDGIVEDIEVFSNISDTARSGVFSNYLAYNRIFEIEKEQKEYYKELYDTIDLLRSIPDATFSDDINYYYQKAKDYSQGVLPFNYDKNVFGGIILKFKVTKKVPLRIGSKITNRLILASL